jgi:DNA-binding NtrC family response regulator
MENEIERLLVLGGDQDVLPLDLLSPRVRDAEGAGLARAAAGAMIPGVGLPGVGVRGAVPGGTLKDAVENLEREMIAQGLIRTHWNKSQLAKDLGISRSNLIQKCAYYGLDRKEGNGV